MHEKIACWQWVEEQLKRFFRIFNWKSFQNEKMHHWRESTKWRHIHSNTYSETSWTESSLHFSVGSANSFKAGFRISVKVTWSKVAGKWGFLENTSFLIFSKALFLVPLFSSDRQLISLWRLYKRKRLIITSLLTNEKMIVTTEKFRPEWDSNSDLYNAGAVLNQLSHWANWELIVRWVRIICSYEEYTLGVTYLNCGLKWSLKCEILTVF